MHVGSKSCPMLMKDKCSTVADLEIQKRGFSHWCAKCARKFLGCHAHFRHAGSPNWISRSNSRPRQCLEISKELIRECVTMPGCCCCMPLLHNHLMDSCSCVRKNTLLAAKGGCICTPLTPPKSATAQYNYWWYQTLTMHVLPLTTAHQQTVSISSDCQMAKH